MTRRARCWAVGCTCSAADRPPSSTTSSASTPRAEPYSTVGALPRAQSDVAVAATGGTAYVVGGYDGTNWLDTILAWRPGSPVRVAGHLPVGLRYSAVSAVGGHILIIGGSTPDRASDAIYRFDPANGQVQQIGRLPAADHARLGGDARRVRLSRRRPRGHSGVADRGCACRSIRGPAPCGAPAGCPSPCRTPPRCRSAAGSSSPAGWRRRAPSAGVGELVPSRWLRLTVAAVDCRLTESLPLTAAHGPCPRLPGKYARVSTERT